MTPARRQALTPDALQMIDAIDRAGSFAAAARELGRVPSALTYGVRQLEDALDVLLFDRRSRQARFTAAGRELLAEARRLLAEMDAVANRVRRVATGWESDLTVAVEDLVDRATLLDLVGAFHEQRTDGDGPPPTRLRLRVETMSGLWEALLSGSADVAVGVIVGGEGAHAAQRGVEVAALGEVPFVYVMAPGHALAAADPPLADDAISRHRAIAVADSARQLSPLTFNLLAGQDVMTVPDFRTKLDALERGLGCGFMPEPLVRDALAAGRLVARAVARPEMPVRLGTAWRQGSRGRGLALAWWLERLASETTRQALLGRPARGAAG